MNHMASIMEWLKQPWEGRTPFEYPPNGMPEQPTRLQVIAALKGMDGGGYGMIRGGGPYRRVGLYQGEAFAWWDMRAFISGWLAGTDDVEAGDVLVAIKQEWERVEALAASEQPPTTGSSP